MSKVVDGIELLRMIRDGKIKNGTKVFFKYVTSKVTFFVKEGRLTDIDGKDIGSSYYTSIFTNKNTKFEIIENEEIDIQAIEELETFDLEDLKKMSAEERFSKTMEEYFKINKIIKAIKQLDNKIK